MMLCFKRVSQGYNTKDYNLSYNISQNFRHLVLDMVVRLECWCDLRYWCMGSGFGVPWFGFLFCPNAEGS